MKVKEFLEQASSYPSIRTELHVKNVQNGLVTLKDGRVAKILVVDVPYEDRGLTQEEMDSISDALFTAFMDVEQGLKVDVTAVKDRKIDREIKAYQSLTSDRAERFRKLSDGVVDVLREGVLGKPYKGVYPRRLRYFITISSLNEESAVPASVRELLSFYSDQDPTAVVSLTAEKLAANLSSLGIETREATDDEVTDLFYFALNPRKSYFVNPPTFEHLPSAVCQSYVEVVNDPVNQLSYLMVDETRAFPIRLRKLTPFTVGQIGLHLIKGWKGDCILNFSTYLSRDVLGAGFFFVKRSIVNSYRQNPESAEVQDKWKELQEFERRLHRGDLPVYFELNGVLFGGDVQEVKTFISQLSQITVEGTKLFPEETVEIDRYIPVHTLLQSLPGNENAKSFRFKTMLSNACDYIPMTGGVKFPGSDGKPSSIFLTREGDVVTFSIFDSNLTAWLALITGDTGSGKSYVANNFIGDMIAQGVKLWILDMQDSYVKLCKYAGGRYYRVTMETPISFNVFDGTDITPETEEEKEYRAEKIRLLLSFLRTVLGRDSKLTAVEEGVLSEAVSTYLKQGSSGIPILGDFRKFLKEFGTTETQRKTAEKFYSILAAYTEEEGYGKFFNRPTSFDEEAQVSVLELGQIQSNPILVETLLMVFLSYVNYYSYQNRGEHKCFVGDEVWSFLKSPQIADFFVTMFRTYRKLGTAAILISQYLSDFLKNEAGTDLSPILKSASIFITMNQPYGDLKELKDKGLIPFREEDLNLFQTGRKHSITPQKEFHLALKNYGGKGSKSTILLPIITPFHDWLFTTKAKAVEYFMDMLSIRMREEDISEADAVALVADELARKHPWGKGVVS